MSRSSIERVVRDNGRYYNPQPLPRNYKWAKAKQCFTNAHKLTDMNPDLTYVEGYAIPDFIDMPIHHA